METPETQTTTPVALSSCSGPRLRVAAFTGGGSGSSPRFRVRQYISGLKSHGIEVTEYTAKLGSWPPSNKAVRPFWLVGTVFDRLPGVFMSYAHDVTLLQREMVSTLLTLEGLTRRPRVLDVDDAVWLNPRADKNFPRLAHRCEAVICGNNFIADNVTQWNRNVFILPTGVDTNRLRPLDPSPINASRPVIGWSGLPAGFNYLYSIERALTAVLETHKDAVFRVVSVERPKFRLLDESRVEYIPWTPENDARTIQEMNVGLMPIEDSLWGRGKCSYKMLVYMSCAIPVVVSPVGMNREVLAMGNIGFGPRSESEWVDSISWLLANPGKAAEMGMAGKTVVQQQFSLDVLTPRLAQYLKGFSK